MRFCESQKQGCTAVVFGKIREAVHILSERILRFQGEGDYEGVLSFMDIYCKIDDELKHDLDPINLAEIPTDITFKQGLELMGL